MTVEIMLNTTTEIIWSLVDSTVMLTEESPKASIDIDKLTDKQKLSLKAAVLSGKIKSNIQLLPLLATQSQPVSPSLQPVATPVKEPAENMATKAKDLLSGNVQSVKKEIMITGDIRLLKLMLALEEGHQKRATVVKALKEKLFTLERAVLDAVEAASGPAIKLSDPSLTIHGKKTISYDVVESKEDERQVEVQLPGHTN